MPEISIVELAIYGFIELFSISMLILGVIKEPPKGTLNSALRCMYLIPGIICAMVLVGSGVDVITGTNTTTTITKNLNTTETWQETITENSVITLQNYVWITIHFMIFLILIAYVIIQVLGLFGIGTRQGTTS